MPNKRAKQDLNINILNLNKIVKSKSKKSKKSCKKPKSHSNFLQFTQISSGWLHSCGVSEQQILCWGYNGMGQNNVPLNTSYAFSIQSLSAGRSHTCSILSGEFISCWGSDEYSQLKTPEYAMLNAVQVSVGSRHSCATLLNKGMICWGGNNERQCQTPLK